MNNIKYRIEPKIEHEGYEVETWTPECGEDPHYWSIMKSVDSLPPTVLCDCPTKGDAEYILNLL